MDFTSMDKTKITLSLLPKTISTAKMYGDIKGISLSAVIDELVEKNLSDIEINNIYIQRMDELYGK